MPRNWQAEDGVEPISEYMMEQFGNWQNYNTVSGCEPTYSASDLTVSVSDGAVKINGTNGVVPAASVTLVPDATNPRWAWITCDASGANISHGTAASDPSVPAIAAFPNNVVAVALVLIEANQTIAANCKYKFDRRMFGPRTVVVSSGGTSGTSSILNADTVAVNGTYTNVPDLGIPVAADSTYMFRMLIHHTTPSTGAYQWRLLAPTFDCAISVISQQFDIGGTGTVYSADGTYVTGESKGLGTSAPGVVAIEGSIVTGSTAGTLAFAHRATVSSGATTTKAKSRIELF